MSTTGARRTAMGVSLDEADALAARLLGDARTTLGGLHVAHARRVAAAVAQDHDEQVVAAALLHDVLEKTDTTSEELLAATGDADLVALVELLTHRGDEPYEAYLARCANDPRAVAVKQADLTDKLTADDSTVAPDVADFVRRRAQARLTLLEFFAGRR